MKDKAIMYLLSLFLVWFTFGVVLGQSDEVPNLNYGQLETMAKNAIVIQKNGHLYLELCNMYTDTCYEYHLNVIDKVPLQVSSDPHYNSGDGIPVNNQLNYQVLFYMEPD